MFEIFSNIAIWPDGSWAIQDEIEFYLDRGSSKDYRIVTFFHPLPVSAIESFIQISGL